MKRAVFTIFVTFFTVFASIYVPVMADDGIKTVFYIEDGESATCTTSARTVSDFLNERGITITPRDTLNMKYTDELESGSKIEIKRGFYVYASVDGNISKFKVSQGAPVGTFIRLFKEQNKRNYYYTGSLADILTPGETVFLTEFHEETVTEATEIPFDTQTIENADLLKGTEKVTQEGQPGEKTTIYKVLYLRDEEQSREILSENVDSEPAPKIIEIGTAEPSQPPKPVEIQKPIEAPKPVAASKPQASKPQASKPQASKPVNTSTFKLGARISSVSDLNYTHVYSMLATAYTAGPESTGKSPGMPGYGETYTGMYVQPGVVAVDPKVIPLGTHLYVEGYGYSIAADIGGSSVQGYHVDLYMESLSAANQWGRKTVKVYILD